MKSILEFVRWPAVLLAVFLWTPMLAAFANSDVPVPLHGVNYSGQTFSYFLFDPTNEKNSGGGEEIGPFEAGGTVCCFTLPAQWRPGLKVEIRETYWLPKRPDTLPELKKNHLVEVPSYAGREAGELWVIRAADGTMSLVSSNYQPNHQKWPGKIKGWPVPDLAYRRQRYDLYIEEAQDDVELYRDLLNELNKQPKKRASESWEYVSRMNAQDLKLFTGPQDPAYLEHLRKRYQASMALAQAELDKLKVTRP